MHVTRISDAITAAASGRRSISSPVVGLSWMGEPNYSGLYSGRLNGRLLRQQSASQGGETCDGRAVEAEASHNQLETCRATKRRRLSVSTAPPSGSRLVKVAAVAATFSGHSHDAPSSICGGGGGGIIYDDVDCADPVNPCPICLANEDDAGAGDHAMCFECGHMFCTSCNLGGMMPASCPMCRADNHPSPAVRAERLGRLVARSAGRHTSWARCALGATFFAGFGVEKDEVKGVQLLRLAADTGLVWAQHTLGNIYLNSDGSGPVRRNYAEAARFHCMAALQGNRESQLSLAMMYEFVRVKTSSRAGHRDPER